MREDRSIEQRLAGLDAPVPLPAALRERLEHTLLVEAGAALSADGHDGNPLVGIDAPLTLPPLLRKRLETSLVARSARRPSVILTRVVATAAAVVLVLASATAVLQRTPRHRARGQAVAAGPHPTQAATSTSTTFPIASQGAPLAATAAPAVGASGSAAGASGTAAGAAAAPVGRQGTAPPFMFGTGAGTARAPTGAPVHIGVVGGDQAEEAGFRAYVDVLNRTGGAGGHGFDIVATSASSPGAGVVVTVNLSGHSLASASGPPPWITGPLLETIPIAEATLTGRVFDMASPVERQARLLVDAVYPDAAPGTTAVIYQSADGPFGNEGPNTLDASLRARQITPVHVVVHASEASALVPADAAFVSLDPADAAQWVGDAHAAGYAPARGVAGLSSLLDASLLPSLSNGTRVMSPYLLPAGQEATAMSGHTGKPASNAVTHGWDTAKALAAAVWQSGATTTDGVLSALQQLTGFDDGFAPAYRTRPGSNARLADAVLFRVAAGQFAQDGGFRTDPA